MGANIIKETEVMEKFFFLSGEVFHPTSTTHGSNYMLAQLSGSIMSFTSNCFTLAYFIIYGGRLACVIVGTVICSTS